MVTPHAILETEDREYKLYLGTNAISVFEEIANRSYINLMQEWQLGLTNIKDLRALLFASFQEFHSEEISTLKEVGDLMDSASWEQAMSAVKTALEQVTKRAVQVSKKESSKTKKKKV